MDGRAGGIAGYINGSSEGYFSVINTTIEGINTWSTNIGGIFGIQNTWGIFNFQVKDCNIISNGNNIGGVIGQDPSWHTQIFAGEVVNTIVGGTSYVGGVAGLGKWNSIHDVSVNANVTATAYSAGGAVGYLQNENMTAAAYYTSLYRVMILDSNVQAPANAGGLIGEIDKELYRDIEYYYDNFIHANVICDDPTTSSLIIGSTPSENPYILNTYVYRYSLLNNEYVYNTTDVIEPEQYLTGDDLRNESTYSNFINTDYYDVSCIIDELYPKLYDSVVLYPDELGEIPLPVDPTESTNSIIQNETNNSIAVQSLELPSITYYPISAYEFNIDFSSIPENTYFTYSINGQEIDELEIQQKTYTFRYNYQDIVEIKIKNVNEEDTITINPNDLISKISLVGDTISYLSDSILYINGVTSGEYINVFKCNALSKDGYVLDTSTNSIIISEVITTELEEEAKPQNIYTYNGSSIEVYGTYSKINGNIKSQIYTIKNGMLSAISSNLNMKIGNIVTDNFNGKEYQTILNTDGELEDLKEQLNYPEDFLNSTITQLVQNEASEKTQAMIYYESGRVIVFDYVTGEIIYDNGVENDISLFSFIADSFSNIWSDYEEKQEEYQSNMELIEKLEETPIEEAIQLNSNNSTNTNNIIDSNNQTDINEEGISQDYNNTISSDNNVSNNITSNNTSSKNNYITVYNPDTNDYEVYSENEILTGEEEEPVSENKKIQINGLQNFYNYEVAKETKSEVNGIVIISATIIIVLLALIVLRRYMYIKRKSKKRKSTKNIKH